MTLQSKNYHVITENGWNYVVDPEGNKSGPWRYRWEAQEEADELSAAHEQNVSDGGNS